MLKEFYDTTLCETIYDYKVNRLTLTIDSTEIQKLYDRTNL